MSGVPALGGKRHIRRRSYLTRQEFVGRPRFAGFVRQRNPPLPAVLSARHGRQSGIQGVRDKKDADEPSKQAESLRRPFAPARTNKEPTTMEAHMHGQAHREVEGSTGQS